VHVTRLSTTGLSWLSREWQTLKSEIPKGFEKYFPGGKKAQPKPEEPVKPNQPKGWTSIFFCSSSMMIQTAFYC
jgi:hypothetical protein